MRSMEYRQREIIPVGAFPFDIALDYLRTWTAATFEIISDDHYRRALRVNGQDVLLELTRGDAGHLTLAVTGAAVTDDTADAAAAIVRRVFGLDIDPTPF